MTQRLAGLALILVAPAVALGLLAVTGSLSPEIPGLPSPGQLTRLGLPVTQALRDLAAMVTVGGLCLAVTCIPPDSPQGRDVLIGARRRLVDIAARSAGLWSALSLVLLVFTYADVSATSPSAPGFADQLAFFATDYDLGKYLFVGTVLALLVNLGATVCRTPLVAGLVGLLAVVALWPMALTAHGAGALRHDLTVDTQAAHLVGVSLWVGGLVGLVAVRRHLGDSLLPTVRHYSRLAGWCFALLLVAGVLGAALRVESLSGLTSDYGLLLGLKIVAAATLGVFGIAHRRRILPRLAAGEAGAFWKLASVEALVMVGAAGVAVALSRTPPPRAPGVPAPITAAEDLLGYALPDPLGAAEWLTAWRVDGFWLPVAVVALALYVAGVLRLRRRGDRWSTTRSVCWIVGWLMFIWATNGAPGAYGRVLFSMHMVQHMTIATTVPVLLVLGAPVTLALRALRRRTDGSIGPREALLALVHAPFTRFLAHPVVAAGLFIISLVAFYYGPWFSLALESHTGHVVMTGHFLLTGYLFAGCLVGVDPGLRQPIYPMRVLLVIVTFGFHALFSVSLMSSTRILAQDWFSMLGRRWGASAADDQHLGASLGWALGDYPLALLAGVLVVLWVRDDKRESDRFDRREARDGDAQLSGYNDYLAGLARRPGGEPSAEHRGSATSTHQEAPSPRDQ
ncbi:MAG: cytochrome c oxidase assembly protein [Propionibacteriaceae bacterium]